VAAAGSAHGFDCQKLCCRFHAAYACQTLMATNALSATAAAAAAGGGGRLMIPLLL
jgi:hypothetical protein